jgi:hypothetical protein
MVRGAKESGEWSGDGAGCEEGKCRVQRAQSTEHGAQSSEGGGDGPRTKEQQAMSNEQGDRVRRNELRLAPNALEFAKTLTRRRVCPKQAEWAKASPKQNQPVSNTT